MGHTSAGVTLEIVTDAFDSSILYAARAEPKPLVNPVTANKGEF